MSTKTIISWVDGSAQSIEVNDTNVEVTMSIEDRIEALESKKGSSVASITLLASAWTGDSAPYGQVVTIGGVTANTKVDLCPTATQNQAMQDDDVAFITENDNGIVTVYALNGKPVIDYTIQAVLTEVAV